MLGPAEIIRANSYAERVQRIFSGETLLLLTYFYSECEICELLCIAQGRAGILVQWCKYLQTDHVKRDHPVR